MALLYACIARGRDVICEASNAPSNAAALARKVVDQIPASEAGRMSYTQARIRASSSGLHRAPGRYRGGGGERRGGVTRREHTLMSRRRCGRLLTTIFHSAVLCSAGKPRLSCAEDSDASLHVCSPRGECNPGAEGPLRVSRRGEFTAADFRIPTSPSLFDFPPPLSSLSSASSLVGVFFNSKSVPGLKIGDLLSPGPIQIKTRFEAKHSEAGATVRAFQIHMCTSRILQRTHIF